MPPSGHTKPHVLVIGALGGSGTRAVADAFSRIGYVHGPALNRSRDCLSFTYLFVRTGWMHGPVPPVADRLAVLRRVAVSGTAPEAPPLDRLTDAVTERVPPAGSQPFMIKEPNSHIFADAILDEWPDASFLFVHRHPLDMAFSGNTNQLKRWGPQLGIDAAGSGSPEAAQLDLWIRAYETQVQRRTRYPGRTGELDYDRFVQAPEAVLSGTCSALGFDPSAEILAEACAGVVIPESVGRWRQADLSVFRADQIAWCADNGWLDGPVS